MTHALAADVFCQKFPVVFDWTVLVESHHLDFAELNSTNCHSTAWSMTKGKPLIYAQIENLIGHGFKKFLIALFQVDSIVRQQIQQLQSLYTGCTFKCIQVRDSWFFEKTGDLSLQGEKYLQHYINIFLRHSPVEPSFVWVQKIQSRCFNPLQYLKIDPHHSCPLVWVKEALLTGNDRATYQQDIAHQAHLHNDSQHHISKTQSSTAATSKALKAAEALGFWLDIKGFAYRYQALCHQAASQELANSHMSHQQVTPVQGSKIQACYQQVNQFCEEILLKPADCTLPYSANDSNDGMVASRCFNRVSIDSKMGVVVKQSSEVQKIRQEVSFYQSLPANLQIYFPRLIDSNIPHSGTGKSSAWYSLEYYPYKSLSQYFVYYALPIDSWDGIFDRLLSIHQQFTNAVDQALNLLITSSPLIDSKALNQFYASKLNERMAQASTSAPLQEILSSKSICLNGQTLQGFATLQPWLMNRIEQLSKNVKNSFVHGDLCFSNILFESASGVIRLIDPRGDFMGSVNQGDPRYDLAKVLHSVHGRYDFIINDLFRLEQDGLNFELSMPQSDYLETLQNLLFDKIRAQTAYVINDLILLESLLFLTMLPLHRDQPKRQIAFLLTGLKLLNAVYDGTYSQVNDKHDELTPHASGLTQTWPAEIGVVQANNTQSLVSI